MSQTTPTPRRETAIEAYRRQLTEVKPLLPPDWKTRFALRFPEYDTAGGGRLIFDVYYRRTSDPEVLDRLRVIAAEYQAELAEQAEQKTKGGQQ